MAFSSLPAERQQKWHTAAAIETRIYYTIVSAYRQVT
jgi:hypothetical protein